jgi:hypothetical protein
VARARKTTKPRRAGTPALQTERMAGLNGIVAWAALVVVVLMAP